MRIRIKGLVEGEGLLWVKGGCTSFVLASQGGVEAAHGVDRFDGVVGTEGEGYVVLEEGAPGVGISGACGTQASSRPSHVGKQVGGLHGGDNAGFVEALEVFGEEDLGVFDAEAWFVGGFGY